MIKRMWWGMAQYCRRCAAKGYTGEDCWWPANDTTFWPHKNVGARVSQFRTECKACLYERVEARKLRAAEPERMAA